MLQELIDTIRRAGSDAELAERTYRDRDFRSELRAMPELALARFELSTQSAPMREIRPSWRLRIASRSRRAA